MKKAKIFTLLAFTTAVVGGLFCATNLLNTQTNKETNVVAIEKTPKQILAEEFEMKKQRRKNGYHKANKPDEYAKYHQFIQTAIDEEKPSYKFGYRMAEYNKAISKLAATRTEANDSIKWTERGPANVPGRTRALIIDPADATRNTWIVGSASGGIWRTTNGGTTFKNLTPNLPNLATNALAMAVSNQNVIYAGTGEGYGNLGAVMGNGIFKSIDRGETWQLLSSTANDINFRFVTRIVVSPTDEKLVLASTDSGIMRSTDGGLTWKIVFDAGISSCDQIIATANNFSILYASINGGEIIKSTDSGLTWNLANDGIVSAKRIELAISPSNPNKLYASVEVSGTESAVYVSENAALTWTQLDDSEKTHYLGGQGWYDNAIAVMPTNENIAFVAGVNTWRIDTQNTTSTAVAPAFLGVSEINTKSFLSFVNVTNFLLWGGKLQLLNTNLATSVELRFGTGKKQKAHRFLVPTGATSGVPAANYSYQDYVDVPFEAWDIAKNQQLMVSFRDQRRDGAFELELRNDADIPREYIYVHAISYNATSPSTDVAKDGGHEAQTIYSVWPLLAGGTWNPTNLPNATLKINYGLQNFRKAATQNITDVYNEFSKQNGAEEVHADQHSIHFTQLPNNTRVIITNDGGISVSDNAGVSFSKRASGYNTMQCYGVDKAKGFNQYVAGAQDNGSWFSPAGTVPSAETRYTKATGGDGFEVLYHSKQQGKLITSVQYNAFYSSNSGGVSFRTATSGLSDTGEENAPFISRLGSSPMNPDVVFTAGKRGIWKSTDFASSWKTVTTPSSFFFRRSSATEEPTLSPMVVRVSNANPQIVWAASGMTAFTKICVSTNEGNSFLPVENYKAANSATDFPMGGISGFATHPTEQNTAFAIFSLAARPKILRTKDLGKTWEDVTGFATVGSKSSNGFPDVSVYSVFVFPRNLNKIWAGTEIGIYESLDAGLTWKFYNDFPAVSVWQMKMVDNQIVVATHGRGIWTGEVPDSQVLGLFNDKFVTKPLAFYPNPAKTTITLQLALDLQKYKLSIYNLLGQVVKTENIEAAYQQTIDINTLLKGVYVLHLQSNKEHFSSKLVVE